jgi:pimeloyl-ACP methyl ester carboxylesterase
MRNCNQASFLTVLAALVASPGYSQQSASWRDPSSHTVRFVSVEKNVRLEVLDWGGTGQPVLLLAGGGNTAHVFDEFAPKLATDHHVYGITRRGFGTSGFSTSEHPVDRLRDDVLAVIRGLKLQRPVLVGHSIAGAELSAVANSAPDRVAGLVYLEAAYPYAFEDGDGPQMKEFQIGGPPSTSWWRRPGQLQRSAKVGCRRLWIPDARGGVPPNLGCRFVWPASEGTRFPWFAVIYDNHDDHQNVHPDPSAGTCHLRKPPRSRELDG